MNKFCFSDSKYIQTELFKSYQSSDIELSNCNFTFIDLFAGIGGFRIPLQELGGQCLAYAEIDLKAIQTYEQNFINSATNEQNLGDITKLGKLPFDNIDLIVGGVPCQPWSIAGKLKGFNDNRGKLWFDVIRIIKLNQPKGFIFENVKGLTEPRNKEAFYNIISQLQTIGYNLKWQVLNSYDFGLSQDRDRVFIVGIRKDLSLANNFEFPSPINKKTKLFDFIEGIEKKFINKRKFTPNELYINGIPASRGRFQKDDELNDFFIFSDIRNGNTTIHSWDLIKTNEKERLICETILTNRRKKMYGNKDGNPLTFMDLQKILTWLKEDDLLNLIDQKIIKFIPNQGYDFVNSKISSGIKGIAKIFLPNSDVISTLTATGTRDYIATICLDCQDPKEYKQRFIKDIYEQGKFKQLNARDVAKLQGFPNWFKLPENENIAKKQLGNAVSVPVIYHLAKQFLKIIFN